MSTTRCAVVSALVMLHATTALAQDSTAAQDSGAVKRAAFSASLKYQTGDVTLPGSLATLRGLGPQYRYLDGHQAARVLRAWGNPVDHDPLGMLVPAGMSPIDSSGWAIIITYQDDGYIPDSGASRINNDSLLAQLRNGVRESNPERVKAGYASLEIVGWALPPHYDAQTKKLVWAEELASSGSDTHTLNYRIRILGRRGVLVLNAVSMMDQLPAVQAATPTALAMVEFNPGNRYTDFIPGKDKVAAYGIGALVLGGIAAKAGLFKGLIVLLVAAKKLLIVAVAAVVAWVKRLLGRDKKKSSATPSAS